MDVNPYAGGGWFGQYKMMHKTFKKWLKPWDIWEYSVKASQWIPTWRGLDSFHKALRPCPLDGSSLSIREPRENPMQGDRNGDERSGKQYEDGGAGCHIAQRLGKYGGGDGYVCQNREAGTRIHVSRWSYGYDQFSSSFSISTDFKYDYLIRHVTKWEHVTPALIRCLYCDMNWYWSAAKTSK